MKTIAFIYDCQNHGWQESWEENFQKKDIESLTTGIVWQDVDVGGSLKWDGAFSWWDEEQGVVQEVMAIREGRHFLMADGRKRSFLPGYFQAGEVGESAYSSGHGKGSYEVPFRWRISQAHPAAPLLVRLDIMELLVRGKDFVEGIGKCRWQVRTFSALAVEKRMVSSPYGFFFAKGSSGKDEIQEPAPSGRADDLPEPVAEAVLEALGESYQAVWGVKPAVTSQQPAGKQQVIAYIERPFDTNIVCLHSYLGTAFSVRVPRESRDPYRLFMDALELKPPPSLRHAYLQNPYAVTLWLLLRRAGFEDINIMRRFLHGQSFLGFELRGFYLDKEQGYVRLRDQRKDFMLQDKLEVCSWLREERGEATAARVILATFPGFGLWQGWRRWPAANAARMQADTLHYLRRGERMLLEEETRQEFLRHGLTGHVHDMCVQDMNHMNYSSRYPCKAITYPLEAQGWNCMVDGVYFALPQDTDELIELGKKFHNCVASYYGRVLKGASIIVGAMFRDQAAICIEVVDKEIMQAFGPCNMCLNGLRIRVLQDWADKCGLCMNKARLLG